MIIPSTTLTFLQNYKLLKDNAKFHGFLGHVLQGVRTCGRVDNNETKILHSGCYDISSTTTTYSANLTCQNKEKTMSDVGGILRFVCLFDGV